MPFLLASLIVQYRFWSVQKIILIAQEITRHTWKSLCVRYSDRNNRCCKKNIFTLIMLKLNHEKERFMVHQKLYVQVKDILGHKLPIFGLMQSLLNVILPTKTSCCNRFSNQFYSNFPARNRSIWVCVLVAKYIFNRNLIAISINI